MKSNKIYIFFMGFLMAILGSSIVLNILLSNRAKQYYIELNDTRLDPVGLGNYPLEANPRNKTNTNQTRVVLFGDSRAFSWPSPDVNGYEFINRGIGSQTSVQTIQRFKYHVSPLRPDVIVIQVGINDLKTIALFPERRQSIVANCRANIERIVKESRDLGAIVIISTIFPAGEVPLERKLFWSDQVNQAVKEVNSYIATLAGEKIIVFDAFSLLADEQGLMRREYRSDELHLNGLGYKIINKEFVQLLRSLPRSIAR
jgi:lysophospholipase L1-like esterase